MTSTAGSTNVGDTLTTAESVADSFELLAAESRWFAQEMDAIYASRVLLSRSSVERLVALGERMKPAVQARERLATLEPTHLQAGIAVWIGRHHPEV
jgi:hypothetical protein